jgi:hypothetical protein
MDLLVVLFEIKFESERFFSLNIGFYRRSVQVGLNRVVAVPMLTSALAPHPSKKNAASNPFLAPY